MKVRKVIKYMVIPIGAVVALQFATYFTIAPFFLKNKLLNGRLASLPHMADSAFVRDFYVTDCSVGDLSTDLPHLRDDESVLKEKLNVKYIHFQTRDEFSWENLGDKKYRVAYYTYTRRPGPSVYLYFFFGAQQHESIRLGDHCFYDRDTTYHWVLFFWIKSCLIPEEIIDEMDHC